MKNFPSRKSIAVRSSGRRAKRGRAQEELRKWKHVFENAAWGISLATPDNRFIAVNRAFAEMHNTTPEEWIGRPLLDMFADESKGMLPGLTQLVHTSGHIVYESVHQKKDGSNFPVLTEVSAFKDEHGEVLFRAANYQDITERKQAEKRVHEQTEKLQEAIRSRDTFLSIASHELKTPLTSLKIQTQMIQRTVRTKGIQTLEISKVAKLIDNTEKQVGRLSRLVDDMLDISRIRTGRLTIQPEPFDLCELIHEVVERLTPSLRAIKCAITVQPCGEIHGVWDKLRIEQVITNLLTNAVRYGKGEPVEISIKTQANKVLLAVIDRGIGIPLEHQGRIFERFERAISHHEVSGLGLGLYITRQIVEAHGGRIWVKSKQGKGSIFFVELPLYATPPLPLLSQEEL